MAPPASPVVLGTGRGPQTESGWGRERSPAPGVPSPGRGAVAGGRGEQLWSGGARSWGPGAGGAPGMLHAAGTAANDHFCDYATGARLLAANHKNDAGSCERETETDRETERA